MPQSLSKIILHLVFSTKLRTPWFRNEALQKELYAYMATILRNIECPAIIINGSEDHVHVLRLLSRKTRVMDLVKHANGDNCFAWQLGYGVFSVSESNVPNVRTYNENQTEHHRHKSFRDEFRELCQRHGMVLDERYAWD